MNCFFAMSHYDHIGQLLKPVIQFLGQNHTNFLVTLRTNFEKCYFSGKKFLGDLRATFS